MPAAIGVVVLGFVGISATVATGFSILGISLATAVGGALLIGGSIALQYALAPSSQSAPLPTSILSSSTAAQKPQATISQSIAPRVRIYGRVKAGGVRAFWDSENGNLYQIIMIASDRIDAFEEFLFGDWQVETSGGSSGGTVTTSPPGAHVEFETHNGSDSQSASSLMLSAWSGIWTEDHKLSGIAYSVVKFTAPPQNSYLEMFPQGYNTLIRHLVRGALLYDPREEAHDIDDKATWEWSDNLGLCILDYLKHPDGNAQPVEWINIDSFAAYADLCDELVDLKAGGTEKRYRCGGVYFFSDDPKNVLDRLCASGDAELYEDRDGKIAIRGGAWAEPEITIEPKDILECSFTQGIDKLAAYNELIPTFVDTEQDYQPVEAEAWIDTVAQATQERVTQDFGLDMVQSFGQTRRLAKIKMAKDNPEWIGTIRTKLVGLQLLQPHDNPIAIPTFHLELSDLGINGAFLAKSVSIAPDLSGVEVSVISISEDAYAWDAHAEEGTRPTIPQDTTGSRLIPEPEDLTLTLSSSTVSGGTVVAVITAEVSEPGRPGLRMEVEYRLIGAVTGEWMSASVAARSYIGVSGPVTDGATYEVRARFIAPTLVSGAWCDSVEITVTADAVAPSSPGDLAKNVIGSRVDLTWTNPGTHFYYTKIYRNSVDNFGTSTDIATVYGVPGSSGAYSDTPGTGTWYYWAAAFNVSGVASDSTASVSAVVT